MPLFRDPDRRRHYPQSPDDDKREAPVTGPSPLHIHEPARLELIPPEIPASPMESRRSHPASIRANDREELIHRIKESSPWRLQHTVCESSVKVPGASSERETPADLSISQVSRVYSQTAARDSEDSSPCQRRHLIPAEQLGSPADIQRPRSALHSGDFREGATDPHDPHAPQFPFRRREDSSFGHLSSFPTPPWLREYPGTSSAVTDARQSDNIVNSRSRAPSLGSYSSSYVLKAPTSPLIYQANSTDLDFPSHVEHADVSELAGKVNRRRTLPPGSFESLQLSPSNNQVSNLRSPFPLERQQGITSNQTFFPRRSLTSSYSLQLASPPGGPFPSSRARRSSLASDILSSSNAPMVGSYEESILRGRMSMNSSRPLDFTAKISVAGKPNSKGHSKCPPHVTVPFQAVFYSYPTSGSGRSISDDSPSPYVGLIDLENLLPHENPTRRLSPPTIPTEPHENTPAMPDTEMRRRRKRSRRSVSPKCPPGGSYRIPQQGHVQVMIKNPNKTAVKVFLVPYDLHGMEPGTKTFIRQSSYSAGPATDMPLSAQSQDKRTLRYLVHLNICCPARGRFYLYQNIRVVFANRVPDDDEKVTPETLTPTPRYSPYRPTRESLSSNRASTTTRLAIEQASRRRSIGQEPIPHLRPHASSPGDFPSQHGMSRPRDPTSQSEATSSSHSSSMYGKLAKGDVGYGGQSRTSPSSGSEASESLLAQRLRGLDVQRQEPRVDEHHSHKAGCHDRSSCAHDRTPR
ncbi:uncharacterized protein N7515_004691 [Penicillium bovifimosum]|uniref:Atos-like conserved domain-containing protein n=1 Tax=Penicillium bovifimosum TaxID=126998 RepID=A0A9W9H257_9EURO|nr:uncharacterized protein N7515_004691 [Penicillium bovifimosum]KAJ5135413.1 hypothetical protein N7515_004691 [Penicillium bovifimosum]